MESRKMNSFNDVRLNLELLSEECAEVIQIKSKIIRFGIDDFHPGNKKTNRDSLVQELGDVLAIIDILKNNGIFTEEQLIEAKHRKLKRLEDWYGEN